jgi:pimeloyl-ACP methyl ester carboxylesterase
VNGTRYYYEETGRGHPIVFLHSGLANLRMWDAQVRAFAPRYRVIVYDLPGFGKSETPGTAYSARADLAGLLRSLGVERAYAVGCSLGGSLAIDLTIEHPELVDALVAVAAGLSGSEPDRATARAWEEMEPVEKAGDLDRLNELELQLWVDGPGQPPTRVDPEVRENVRRLNRENLERPAGDGSPIQLNPPAIGRLGEIRVPTLILIGDRDVSMMVTIADTLERGIGGARKVVFPGVAHLISLEEPERFNQVVLDFFQSVAG